MNTLEDIYNVYIEKGYPVQEAKIMSEISFSFFDLGRKQGALEELKWLIKEIRVMPNADDRLPYLGSGRVSLLDGGSVHRFTLIDKIEQKIKELEKDCSLKPVAKGGGTYPNKRKFTKAELKRIEELENERGV